MSDDDLTVGQLMEKHTQLTAEFIKAQDAFYLAGTAHKAAKARVQVFRARYGAMLKVVEEQGAQLKAVPDSVGGDA